MKMSGDNRSHGVKCTTFEELTQKVLQRSSTGQVIDQVSLILTNVLFKLSSSLSLEGDYIIVTHWWLNTQPKRVKKWTYQLHKIMIFKEGSILESINVLPE